MPLIEQADLFGAIHCNLQGELVVGQPPALQIHTGSVWYQGTSLAGL